MIHPLFDDIVDRIFEQDEILHRLVQRLKEEEKENDGDNKDK